MKLTAFHWAGALIFSVSAHFFAASFMGEKPDQMLIEGSAGDVAVVMLGDAAADAIAAGNPSDTLEAQDVAETSQENVQETETAQEPVAQENALMPLEEAVEPAAPEQVSAEAPSEVEAVEEEVLAVETLPVPTARPQKSKFTPKETTKKPAKKETKKAPKTTAAKKKAGSGGTSNTNTQKKAAKGNVAPKSSQAGNAAVSNYPGKVARRLSRSLRYPKSALRGSRNGQANVSFVVTKNGQAKSIRIIASSGNPVLDEAAVDAVERASPFPPIPAGAGRDQWQFTVPIYFKR